MKLALIAPTVLLAALGLTACSPTPYTPASISISTAAPVTHTTQAPAPAPAVPSHAAPTTQATVTAQVPAPMDNIRKPQPIAYSVQHPAPAQVAKVVKPAPAPAKVTPQIPAARGPVSVTAPKTTPAPTPAPCTLPNPCHYVPNGTSFCSHKGTSCPSDGSTGGGSDVVPNPQNCSTQPPAGLSPYSCFPADSPIAVDCNNAAYNTTPELVAQCIKDATKS